MPVITISRQYGSGGDEIAELICKTTGYQLFDKHILAMAAAEVGLRDQEIIDFTEESYQSRGFFERLFRRVQPLARVSTWIEDEKGVRTREELHLSEQDALLLSQKAVEAAYRVGRIVIAGRGGQVVLQDCQGALHVRVEAPLEDRLMRVRKDPLLADRSFSSPVEARRAAQDLLEARDSASAGYLKRFYGVDWSDPALYHLVINTGKLSIEQAAKVILAAAQTIKPEVVGV
jgi:CMP/dCMP kinase